MIYLFITEKNSEVNATSQQQGTKRATERTPGQAKKTRWSDQNESEESDSSSDSEEEIAPTKTNQQQHVDGKKGGSRQNDFEIVPVEDNSKFK